MAFKKEVTHEEFVRLYMRNINDGEPSPITRLAIELEANRNDVSQRARQLCKKGVNLPRHYRARKLSPPDVGKLNEIISEVSQ